MLELGVEFILFLFLFLFNLFKFALFLDMVLMRYPGGPVLAQYQQ